MQWQTLTTIFITVLVFVLVVLLILTYVYQQPQARSFQKPKATLFSKTAELLKKIYEPASVEFCHYSPLMDRLRQEVKK